MLSNFLTEKKHEFLLTLLLLPLLFINISNIHDWGGDFAQYLDQTKDFISGETKTKDVFNGEDLCPNERAAGFSFILSIPYFLFGHNLNSLLFSVSIFVFLFGFVFYRLLVQENYLKTNKLIAVLIVLALSYNYQILKLKLEIMPEFPFMVMVYAALYYFNRNKTNFKTNLLIGLFIGLSISLKNLGWVLYFSLIFFYLKAFYKEGFKQTWLNLFCLSIPPLILVLVLKLLIFGKFSTENITWYIPIFSPSELSNSFLNNLNNYAKAIPLFFEQEVWGWANVVLKTGAICFIIVGVVKKWFSKFEALDLFVLLYLTVLIFYPYDKDLIRFLIPLFPAFLFYLFLGLREIKLQYLERGFIAFIFFGIFSSNYINDKSIISNEALNQYGPENIRAQEAIMVIKEKVKNNQMVAFSKPWVLHYYTEKQTYFLNPTLNEELKNKLIKDKVDYILVCTNEKFEEIFNAEHASFFSNWESYKLDWENSAFQLYRKSN